MIDIKNLRQANKRASIVLTEHARIRLIERGIKAKDIISCIDTGEIIKQYEDDKPFPSCLILGDSADKKRLHVVLSYDGEMIHLITAYYPDPDVWNADLRSRREEST